jgi:ribosomal protein S30
MATTRKSAKVRSQTPKSPAASVHDRLVAYIRSFEAGLDAEQEIAMGFASDESGVLRIEGLGYFDPDIITFYGRDEDGTKTQLIQHVTQLSVTLRAVPKEAKAEPPRRIGFQLNAGWMGGDSGDGSAG